MSDSEDGFFESGSENESELESAFDSEDEMDENDMGGQQDGPWFRMLPPEPVEPDRNNFEENAGPKHMPPPDSKPLAYFLLFMSIDFINKIGTETNRYARNFIANQDRIRRFSRIHAWTNFGETTVTEIKGFLSVIFNMGLIRKASISEYWNTTFRSQDTKWFRDMFSRNRFQLLLKFLHLVDNDVIPDRNSPNYSPTAKFQCIVDHFNKKSQYHLTPEQNLSIDESLVATRGRSAMIQYIPSKSAKYGVKIWMLVEAVSGYILQMDIYKGKRYDPTPANTTQGTHVIMKLLRAAGLLGKLYHVVCDSFFTSLNLAKQLLTGRTFITGTIRQNRQMPNMIKNPTIGEKESVYMRQGRVLMCAYKETRRRKPVRILTTKYNAIQDDANKPSVLHFYNKNMGGVDLADMLNTFYNDNRKCVKVWKKVTFNILHRMMTNAYILYCKNTSDRPVKTRIHFIQSCIEDLAEDHLSRRPVEHVRRNQGNGRVKVRKLPHGKVRDCYVCSDRDGWGGRRRTRTVCSSCNKGVHKECFNNHICVEA